MGFGVASREEVVPVPEPGSWLVGQGRRVRELVPLALTNSADTSLVVNPSLRALSTSFASASPDGARENAIANLCDESWVNQVLATLAGH